MDTDRVRDGVPSHVRAIAPPVLLPPGRHPPRGALHRRLLRGYIVFFEQGVLRLGDVMAREFFTRYFAFAHTDDGGNARIVLPRLLL